MKIPDDAEPGEGLKCVLVDLAREVRSILDRIESDPRRLVHELRVAMKKYRSLLKLARGRIDDNSRRELNALATDLKNELEGSRDALIAHETAREILDESDIAGMALPEVEDTGGEVPAKMVRDADLLIQRTSDLNCFDVRRKHLKKRLRKTLRKAVAAMKRAEKTNNAADYHTWRKRSKDLMYQSAVLCEIHAGAEAFRKPSEEISSILGKEHDITVTLEALNGLSDSSRRKLEEAREALRRKALKLVKRI